MGIEPTTRTLQVSIAPLEHASPGAEVNPNIRPIFVKLAPALHGGVDFVSLVVRG